MQIAGRWDFGWHKRRHDSERRNGTFGFRCYTIVYAIEAKEVSRIKFGVTGNIKKRFRQLSNVSPVELELLGYVWAPAEFERAIFDFLADDRVWGEWFSRTERSRAIAALVASKKDVELADVLEMSHLVPKDAVHTYVGYSIPKD